MWIVNTAISAYTAVETKSLGAFAGGLIGGAIGGGLGIGVGKALAGALGANSFNFLGGAIIGAGEFGMAGFGSGFGSAVGSGASFRDSLKAGGMGAAIGAATGAIIEGSYLAGWQNKLHGLSRNAIGKAAGVERKMSLSLARSPLPKIARMAVGKNSKGGYHWGLKITDNYNEINGTWDFDYKHTFFNTAKVLSGGEVMGIAGLTNRSWSVFDPIKGNTGYISAVYGNIQENLGTHTYGLNSYTCQDWVNNRLFLGNDNFTR